MPKAHLDAAMEADVLAVLLARADKLRKPSFPPKPVAAPPGKLKPAGSSTSASSR
jgi:hypothetical protein